MSRMENQDIEYKSVWRDEYLQWICGFANARGGIIYIGISDNGKVVGVKNADRLLEDIPNKTVSVLGIVPYVQLHKDGEDTSYLEIGVEPQEFPISCKGLYYVRSGATNQLLKGVALDTFLLRKQGRTWDAAVAPRIAVEDLDRGAIVRFFAKAQREGRIPASDAAEDSRASLERLHLLLDGRPTNAAVLLFHPDPDAVYPGAIVKIGFFDGPEILYQDQVAGPIIEQPDRVLDLIYTKYLRAKISYDGIYRIEHYPFPRAAVREAVINAIVHKNYTSTSPIQIRVYDDRLRIGNACILPDGWTVDDLLGFHESEPHNPKIAHTFFLAGLVESWGRGVQKIFAACKFDGIEPPVYRMTGGSLQVEFAVPGERMVKPGTMEPSLQNDVPVMAENGATWRDLARLGATWRDLVEIWDGLSAREHSVLDYLASNGPSRTSDISTNLGIPLRTLQRTMKRLAGLSLIVPQGKANESRYALMLDSEAGGS
ncbi:hypothetical protein EII22_11020 [Coriobacteriales bacterium OH1046]|nr:hypothetical protein EII22_11020 [Coriobacteriales bacterium OH1046]